MTTESITSIDSFIGDGLQTTISLHNLYDTILVGDENNPDHIYRTPIDDFFIKHRQELRPIEQVVKISEPFYYKPKLLSYKLYSTTELWLAILRVNNMRNVSEFCKPYIKIYNPNSLESLIRIFFKREGKM